MEISELKFKAREEHRQNANNYISLYNNLALFSGSAIVLSITYLGYLRENIDKYSVARNEWLLVASWIYFALVILSSLFRNRQYLGYLQFDSIRPLYPSEKDQALLEKNIRWKEKHYAFLGTLAEVSFVSGIISLIIFAIKTGTNF